MNRYLKITNIHGREIMDSRGNPTVEAEVTLTDTETGERFLGRAAVPSGASTGQFEAIELRDGETRYRGLGVTRAVSNVNTKIKEVLLGKNGLEQENVDRIMIEEDGTDHKGNLGANATLAVSLANARASALALRIPLFRFLGGTQANLLPVPMMNILNGGAHAANTVDFQEFMIMPVSAVSFREGLRICSEIYHQLKLSLNKQGLFTGVGDEGGFAPNLPNAESVLSYIMEAVKAAGYKPGEDIVIALDVAASELYREADGNYFFSGESELTGSEVTRDTNEMIAYYEKLTTEFPVVSIEDGLAENDWEGWKELTKKLGKKVQLVGDDLFVTNVKRLEAGIKLGCANSILIKLNQIGTLSETIKAVRLAGKAGYTAIASHRSGETADSFIADLAVALNMGQIKTGAPCRGERVEKYNQLLRIEEELGELAIYPKDFH